MLQQVEYSGTVWALSHNDPEPLVTHSIKKIHECGVKKEDIQIRLHEDEISYYLILFLLTMFHEEFIQRISYQSFKTRVSKINNYVGQLNSFEVITHDTLSQRHEKYKLNTRVPNERFSFITFTNYGYLKFTKNLLLSLEKCCFPIPLKIYCIDSKLENFNIDKTSEH